MQYNDGSESHFIHPSAPAPEPGGAHDVQGPGGADDALDGQADAMPMPVGPSVCPAMDSAKKKFDDMFKRDSPNCSWNVYSKPPKHPNNMGDPRLPRGFPTLADFVMKARSTRVLEWGYKKYKELYPDGAEWTDWVEDSFHPAHIARYEIMVKLGCPHTDKFPPPTPAQRRTVAWLAVQGFWSGDLGPALGEVEAILVDLNDNRDKAARLANAGPQKTVGLQPPTKKRAAEPASAAGSASSVGSSTPTASVPGSSDHSSRGSSDAEDCCESPSIKRKRA
jgi:hypothetical protein